MKSKRVVLVALVALLVVACCVYYVVSRQGVEVLIQGYDVISLPGEKVSLRAKVESADPVGLRPDVRGEKVIFREGGAVLGSAPTRDEGVACVEMTFEKKGLHHIEASLSEDSSYKASPAKLLVLVADAGEKLVITDIDHTIADVSEVEFLLKANEEVPALEDSARVLTRVSRDHHVLYLTARDDRFITKTREWLRLRGFPEGPAYFRDLRLDTLSGEKYKTEAMADFKKRFANIVFGFGDRVEDALAYSSQGVKSFIIGAKQADLPEGATAVEGWSEIEKWISESRWEY